MKIKSVITALLLGALGSGLWSIAGEPLFGWFIETFIGAAQKLNHGYYNLLHEDIGKGLHERSGLLFYNLFLMVLITAYIVLPIVIYFFLQKKKNNQHSVGRVKTIVESHSIKKLNIMFVVSVLLSILFIPTYTSSLVVSLYSNDAIVFLERSIEILSPQLDQKDILQLRADYRSVSDADSYYNLHDKLHSIAKTSSIKLPEFDAAR